MTGCSSAQVCLLPPIIFEAGFNMSLPPTRRNLGLTTFLAFAGTTFSTFVVGGLCYAAGQMGLCYPMGLLASLVFGSLISATDPVSVLSVFKACGVPDDVFAIVFGESVLNDAVASARHVIPTRIHIHIIAPKAQMAGSRFDCILLDCIRSLESRLSQSCSRARCWRLTTWRRTPPQSSRRCSSSSLTLPVSALTVLVIPHKRAPPPRADVAFC